MSSCTDTAGPSPLFSFGVIADVQYADIDDGYNFSRTRKRYYRNALNLLKEAVSFWSECCPQMKFVLQLGDIIDGFNRSRGTGSAPALETVMREINHLPVPVYHNWGNHEFYNFSRQYLMSSVLFSGNQTDCSCVPGVAYYTIRPCPKLQIVSLDCYDISALGYEKSDTNYQQAMEILRDKNPNEDKNDPRGLHNSERRFVKFNGAVGRQQLEWLEETLQQAQTDRVNVIVIGHTPLLASSGSYLDILWNYEDVLSVFGRYKDCILCYMSGHDHTGGYDTDQHGILHITMPGIIETPPETNNYSTVDLHSDKLSIRGEGTAGSFVIQLKFSVT